LEREKIRKRSLNSNTEEQLPEIPDHYDWLGEPVIYVNMGYQALSQVDQKTANIENIQNIENDEYYTIQANGDLLGMEGRFSMTKAPNINSHREVFTLYKRPLTQSKTLFAGLEYMALGDVYAVSDSLIFDGGDGLGVDLQFGQATSGSGFGKKIIEGEGPPGWEVELYRNGALLDFQRVGSDGLYRFTDVPVEYGENIFDVRIFGPQGQARSARESINVGNEMLAKGQTAGRLSFTNLGESVLDEKQDYRVDEPDNFGKLLLDEEQDYQVDELENNSEFFDRFDDKKSYTQIKHGVTDWLAVAAGAAQHDNVLGLGNNNQYTELGLSGALPGLSLELNQVTQAGAGHAELISGQTRLGSAAISFTHKTFTNFRSDRNSDGTLDSESEARVSGQLDPFYITPISYFMTYNNEQLVTGNEINTWDGLVGFQAFNGRINIDTTYTEFDNIDTVDSIDNTVVGRTSYNRVVGTNISIRADINYRIEPEYETTSASTNITWFPANNIRGQLGINKDLTNFGTDSLDITASYLMEEVTLSASALITENGDNAIFLSAEFSLGYEGNNRWSVTGQSRGQYGRAKANVFHDRDLNGVYSEGDQPLEGVEFIGRSRWKGKETDQNGIVYLDGLSVDSDSVIAVNESSLGDPYLKPLFNKSTITSHAGGINYLEIAVVSTVEAEGSLSIQRNGEDIPLPGIPINVKNADGKIIATTITEFDGFYIFSGLAPGMYWLSIDSKALTRYKIEQLKEIPFHAKANDGITYLDKIVLKNSTSSLSD
jgi:hypothetical protein